MIIRPSTKKIDYEKHRYKGVLYFSFEVSGVVTTHSLKPSRPAIFWYLNAVFCTSSIFWLLDGVNGFFNVFKPLLTFEWRTYCHSIKTLENRLIADCCQVHSYSHHLNITQIISLKITHRQKFPCFFWLRQWSCMSNVQYIEAKEAQPSIPYSMLSKAACRS